LPASSKENIPHS